MKIVIAKYSGDANPRLKFVLMSSVGVFESLKGWHVYVPAFSGWGDWRASFDYLQRGGAPTAWDRQLCMRFGVSAVEFDMNKYFQIMWIAVAILAAWLIRAWPRPVIAAILIASALSPMLIAVWHLRSDVVAVSVQQERAARWIAANTPERPWHSVPNWPAHVTGDEMVAAMDKVGVDGAIFISAFSMYRYDASYAVEVQRAHPGRFAIVKPVDPDDPAVADVVADWKNTPGTVGIRIMLTKEAKREPDDPGLDRIVLDLPEPWRVVKHAEAALQPGGILLAYLPTIGQVARLREELAGSAFGMAESLEVLQRSWHVDGQSVRPDHRMVAHTGFLTHARLLTPQP